jgi:hypothetical protein
VKKYAWMFAIPMALMGTVLPCAAQVLPSAPPVNDDATRPASYFPRPLNQRTAPCPCPPSLGTPTVPSDPTKKSPDSAPQQPTAPPGELPSETGYKSSFGLGTATSAGAGIGASAASAAAGLPATTNGANISPSGNAHVATVTNTSTPLIIPGLFTAASVQSVMPMDRVSFDYGYFNRFAISSPTGPTAGFNLNQFNIGIEKTIFNGMASVYVSVPFLSATDNISGQDINGLGDVNVGFKVLFFQDKETGTALSGGMTVAAPTAHSTTFSSTSTLNLTFTGPTQPGLPIGANLPVTPLTTTTTVNPTFLQPWIGGLWARDGFFVQEYFGVLVPTDNRISTIINNNVTLGYEIYRNPNGFLSSITPTFGVQLLLPVSNVNNSVGSTTSQVPVDINCLTTSYAQIAGQIPNSSFGFPDQVFLTAGGQFGLGQSAMLSASVVVPVAGPRGYSVGATVGLNFFY